MVADHGTKNLSLTHWFRRRKNSLGSEAYKNVRFWSFALNLTVFPPKYFYQKITRLDKIRFSFFWCPLKNLTTYRLVVTGRKLKADLTKNYFFFLFFTKNDIKTLFEWCNQETFNFWNKGFSCQFQGIKLKFSGPAFDHPRQTRQYETFDWDQLGNLSWRHFLFVLAEKIQVLVLKVFTAKFHIKKTRL